MNLREIKFIITKVPQSTSDTDEIYLSGMLCNWYPNAGEYRFQKKKDNSYYLKIATHHENFEYKITKGSWESSECKSDGSKMENRNYTWEDGDNVTIEIESWSDKYHSASQNVKVLNEQFYIPQLNRYRRIWIYLPPGYETGKKRYPVFYMLDGQNLFDKFTSFSGEWKVDKTINGLYYLNHKVCIVIGIDSDPKYRKDEYLPAFIKGHKKSESGKFAEFIVLTLKPFIDQNFRTYKSRQNTGIIGSLEGGAFAFYAGLTYQHIFSMVGVFSPYIDLNDNLFSFIEKNSKKYKSRICFLSSVFEISFSPENVKNLIQFMRIQGYAEDQVLEMIKFNKDLKEKFWSTEFPFVLKWLLEK